jgi:hypothetical protein
MGLMRPPTEAALSSSPCRDRKQRTRPCAAFNAAQEYSALILGDSVIVHTAPDDRRSDVMAIVDGSLSSFQTDACALRTPVAKGGSGPRIVSRIEE